KLRIAKVKQTTTNGIDSTSGQPATGTLTAFEAEEVIRAEDAANMGRRATYGNLPVGLAPERLAQLQRAAGTRKCRIEDDGYSGDDVCPSPNQSPQQRLGGAGHPAEQMRVLPSSLACRLPGRSGRLGFAMCEQSLEVRQP
ncbi:MAG: hypothetical protein MZW92_61100, partial [Comamonadaceae bacterium]|nr:hypothetical protein [Comamonadaceae bacterium]